MKFDITKTMREVERLIPIMDEPHRSRLETYRKHALLEIAGRADEVLMHDLAVEHPVYHFRSTHGTRDLDGYDDVFGNYKNMLDTGANVIYLQEHNLSFADWGFVSEALVRIYMPGRTAKELGHDIDDLDATYLEGRWGMVKWTFDDKARVIGEDVYQVKPHMIEKLAPEDVWTPEATREALAPVIDNYPFYKG